jgi:murein DD-endopeptidase MepM/ murein hydrolase activator NlpD
MKHGCPDPATAPGRRRRLPFVALVVAVAAPAAVAALAPAPAAPVGHPAAGASPPASDPAAGRGPGLAAAAGRLPLPDPAGRRPPDPEARRPPDPGAGRVPVLRMPAMGAVVRGFEAPAGPYGPGHRGIDIAVPVGERAWAPTDGRTTFAGPVAGTVWVSLAVAPGVLVTLGPLHDPATVTGRQVRAGAPLGRVAPGHGPPIPPTGVGPAGGSVVTLHLGLRVDGVYVDPLPYLVDRPRPRLAPLLAPGGLPRP